MSINCLLTKNYSNEMRLGRLVCSFIFLISLIFCSNSVFAQNAVAEIKPSISVKLLDLDGDGFNDAEFENANIKLVISSKTGCVSFYYLKGEKYEENIYPPHIESLGYSFDKNIKKVFGFDNSNYYFSNTSYKIEIESQNDNEAVIKATAETSTVVDENTPDDKSMSLVRRYILPNEGYNFKIDNCLTNLKEKLIQVGNNEGSFTFEYGPGIFMEPYGPTTLLALKSQNDFDSYTSADSLNDKGKNNYVGIGMKDQYFCVMMESDQPLGISVVASKTVSVVENRKQMDTRLLKCSLPKFNLGARETRSFVFNVYAGPLILNELKKINRTKIADYGWLVKQMLEILRFFYSLIPSYGIAIILLTLLVRLILYPLTLKQSKEMAKMQKIQPKVKALQDKYKDDPQRLNEEVMKLYTKNNVNPLGGCFPMLLQLPIIMALFNTFRNAVELRKASFLWMSDLSKGDPYLILPIAIAALMYYQQGKTTADPQQKQAMAFMPIMMLFITFSLPSGLLVYWFASSVLGILQHIQANRYTASLKEEI